MTRTEKLSKEIEKIYATHKREIAALDRKGPRGGFNARCIPGWTKSPSGTVSKAINMFGGDTMGWWTGSNPTPSTAIPTCVVDEVTKAWARIF